jgi:hypothetical protein
MVEIENESKRKFYKDFKGNKIYITDEKGNKIYVTNDFIDISYNSDKDESINLSNLSHYDFNFLGFQASSIRGVLEGLKYRDMDVQQLNFMQYGEFLKYASSNNKWQKTNMLYFNNEEINRFSIEYQQLLNELYLSLLLNGSFFYNLLDTNKKVLLYSDGIEDPNKTILTSREFILRLECIRDHLIKKASEKETRKKLDILAQVIAEEQAKIVYQKRLY